MSLLSCLVLLIFCLCDANGFRERVETVEQLAAALSRRVEHIVITKHLDLTTLPLSPRALNKEALVVEGTLLSITGDCDTAPQGPFADPKYPVKPKQCVLVTKRNVFTFVEAHNLFMSNLYFKVAPTPAPLATFQVILAENVRMWMLDVTFQRPSGQAFARGMLVKRSDLYCRGCDFFEMYEPTSGGWAMLIGEYVPANHTVPHSTVSCDGCKFFLPPNTKSQGFNALIGIYSNTSTRIANADYGSSKQPVAVDHWAKVSTVKLYLDKDTEVWWSGNGTLGTAWPLSSAEADKVQFLKLEDPWPQQIMKMLREEPGKKLATGAIAGVATACVVALLLAAAIVFAVLWHRRRRSLSGSLKDHMCFGSGGSTSGSTIGKGLCKEGTSLQPIRASGLWHSAHPAKAFPGDALVSSRDILTLSHGTDQRLHTSNTWTMQSDNPSTLGIVPTCDEETQDGTPLDELERVLDHMHESNELFFGKFAVLNFLGRRTGGQGCVQFMRRVPDQVQYAIKFFLQNEKAFEREHELYSDPALRPMLPEALHIVPNKDSRVVSESGYVFPPFIMVEKGESLNEWASRKSPDFATSLFVLLHIAERLQRLHEVGICHRDIKPANILWRPLSNSWTLIDYGCAASIGSEAELLFSLPYAPPEVAAAAARNQKEIKVDAAVDVWALGIIAFELLTRQRVFVPFETPAGAIMEHLLGKAPLPWQGPEKDTLLSKLRVLKRSILSCLAFDPAERPTSAVLLGKWNSLFETETGTTREKFKV